MLVLCDGGPDCVKGPRGTCLLIRHKNKPTKAVPIELCKEVIYCCPSQTDKLTVSLTDNYLWFEWLDCVETSVEWWEAVHGIAESEREGTRAETRNGLSAKRTSPFKSAGGSVQSTTGSRGVRISRRDYWLPTPFASFPFTSPPVRHRVPSHSDSALYDRYC